MNTTFTKEKEEQLIAQARFGNTEALKELTDRYQNMLLAAIKHVPSIAHAEAMELAKSAFYELVMTDGDPKYRLGAYKDQIRNELKREAIMRDCGVLVPDRTLRRYMSVLKKADNDKHKAAEMAPSYFLSQELFWKIATILEGSIDVSELNLMSNSLELPDCSEDEFKLCNLALNALDDDERRVVEVAIMYATLTDSEAAYHLSIEDLGYDAVAAGESTWSTRTVKRLRKSAMTKMRIALGLEEAATEWTAAA